MTSYTTRQTPSTSLTILRLPFFRNCPSNEIASFHCSQRNNVIVHPPISHDANSFDRKQSCECPTNFTVEPSSLDLLNKDVICFTCDADLFRGNFAQDSNGDFRSREWVTLDQPLWNPQIRAELADLVLEELMKGLDEFEAHTSEKAADIMVGFNRSARAFERYTLNHIWVESAL